MLTFNAILLVALMPALTQAASAPRWSMPQLASFADIVLTGRIVSVTPAWDTGGAWDTDVNAIYTYVTVDVAEVLKGDIGDAQVTIKQLGGVAGGVGLSISDQATFTVGEEVLLYLEARPRDGTLYTTALWQGKWALQRDARGQVAVRQPPGGHAGADERVLVSEVRQSAALVHERRQALNTKPRETPPDRASAEFALLGPFRYLHSPYVDAQSGGQPGLAGGGFAQMLSALNRWNAAGSAFRYRPGHGNSPPRCSTQLLDSGRVTISFMDPCQEMSNTGGTLALGGSYFVAGEGGTSNGQHFDRAVEGFVVNNDSPLALQYLSTPGCFEDIQTHELGHVLGLHHSSDPTALMFATIDGSSCAQGARGLRPDDVAGIVFVYGGASPPQSAPANLGVVLGSGAVTVAWSAVTSGSTYFDPMIYRVDFRTGHQDSGPLAASRTTADTTLTVAVPPGVSGAFSVVVTAVNAAGAGPASSRVDFTVPTGSGSCGGPSHAVQGMRGTVTGEYAYVQWDPVDGATSYQLQVGTTAGGDDLLPRLDLGLHTGAGASVPAGFSAWIRVYAANQCGESQPVDFFLR
ncbi:MAG TPA: matrixin family metalloprotease [Vicinamibacterales bacterium]|nr:matrixin family metalloprotease [Vicinamibacterales bacterium]